MAFNLQGLLASIGSTSPTTARNRDIIERLLGRARAAQLVEEASDDDEDAYVSGWWPSNGRHYQYSPASEPQEAGVALQNGGEFGPPSITKQPLQRSLNEARRSLSLPIRGDLFQVIE